MRDYFQYVFFLILLISKLKFFKISSAKFEAFNNLQTLREHWNTDASDKSNLGKIKRVFRAFSKWFLEEKAIRYILNGRMKNKERYIHYKNKVMLYYINHPEKYNRNTRT